MKVQPKTNEVLELLFEKIKMNDTFSDLDGARIKRDINNLHEFSEINMAMGLFYTAQRNIIKTIEHFEKAIKVINASSVVFINYLYSYSQLNLHHDASIRIIEFANTTNSPILFNTAMTNSKVLLDIEMYRHCLKQLNKMKKLDNTLLIRDATIEMSTLINFIKHNDISDVKLNTIGKIASEITQNHGVTLIGNSIKHKCEREYLSVDYHIDATNCSAENMCDLNYTFIEKLIELELDQLPITVTFIRHSPETVALYKKKGAQRYVS